MSVKKYAYKMLDLFSSDENYASFRTIIVDLLNYGAASQVYAGYQTDNLVNSELTDVQKVGQVLIMRHSKTLRITITKQ